LLQRLFIEIAALTLVQNLFVGFQAVGSKGFQYVFCGTGFFPR
jgi:hypothetical protein